jgi:hypothetical protein
MAGTTGLLIALMTWRPGKAFGLAVLYTAMTYTAFMVGWGTYFDIGHESSPKQRTGSFDWLYGPITDVWQVDHGNRLIWRDLLAMSLRGTMQTVPQGLMMMLAGYGPLPMLSGIMMG